MRKEAKVRDLRNDKDSRNTNGGCTDTYTTIKMDFRKEGRLEYYKDELF